MKNLKERLAQGEYLIGGAICSNSADVVEWAAGGLDWIWWDAQHAQGDWHDILTGVRTARLRDIPVLIRTWTHDGGTIERLLDTGADGIIAPMVDTAEQAAAIVSHCYYPPLGRRSAGSIHVESIEPSNDAWNRRIVTVMQIESPEGVANAEEIAAVPGVDAIHVGTYDLALRLERVAGSPAPEPLVRDAVQRVEQACRLHGKTSVVIVESEDELVARMRDGYRLLCAGVDLTFIADGWRRMREAAGREQRAAMQNG
jgi:4-hydroxy-2-oxoheptanedioate aldolase